MKLSYPAWLRGKSTDWPTDQELRELSNDPRCFPSFSVVVPTWNTREDLLRACLDSVLNQSYPHWQLVVADDASTQPHVAKVLLEYAARDDRVEVVFCSEHGHISATTNAALAKATRMYVAFLDHDDLLDHHALYWMAQAIRAYPDADILYSDEDTVSERGLPLAVYFKSAWNQDLLYAQNYVCHLAVYERGLVQWVGGMRLGVEGSQDHDLILRCLPLVRPEHILHVPRVLYHWRQVKGSVAMGAEAKPYTMAAGKRALEDYFAARPGVMVGAGQVPNTHRIFWPVPAPAPLVSILIPTRDRVELLQRCLSSLLSKTSYSPFELLLLDNDSTQPQALSYLAHMTHDPRVRVVTCPGPFNFSAIINRGAQHARGSLLLLLNNDIEVLNADWLTELVRQASRPEVGCVGAKLYRPDNRIQHAGVLLGVGGVANPAHAGLHRRDFGYASKLVTHQNYLAVTGACLMLRAELFDTLGGLDATNLPVAYNDVDLCLRAWQAGYWNVWTPYAELLHRESASRGSERPARAAQFRAESEFMQAEWGAQLADDPFYHPFQDRNLGDFSLADPLTLNINLPLARLSVAV